MDFLKRNLLFLSVFLIALAIYAVGVATDFFRLPVFSTFWVVSYDTAHKTVLYTVLSLAVALTITGVATKSKKIPSSKTLTKNIQSIFTQKTIGNEVKHENLSYQQEKNHRTIQSNVLNTSVNQESIKKTEGNMTCPSCKKEFFKLPPGIDKE